MEKWQAWSEKFLALSQREKIIIAAAALFLSGYMIYFLLIEPLSLEQQRREAHLKQISQELVDSRVQIDDIKVALRQDPNKQTKQEINALREELARLNRRLDKVMTDYVAPDKMARELTRLLTASNQVRVVGLSIETPQKIEIEMDADATNDTALSYYRHEFILQVQGDYFSLMAFVKSVLGENRQFRVNELAYVVNTHPTATLTLSLLTVSDSKNVIRL